MLQNMMYPVLPAEAIEKILVKDWALPVMEFVMHIPKMAGAFHY